MRELAIEAVAENLQTVMNFITDALSEKNCSQKTLYQLELVLEEIFVNIASYAYEGDERPVVLSVELEDNPPAAVVTFRDKGTPYNPLERSDPDLAVKLEKREIGGLGIFLVKKNVDSIWYEHINDENVLSFRKILS